MGITIIRQEKFPDIVDLYNTGGRMSAYDYIRSSYGVKNPYFIMNRIKKCGKYTYDSEKDKFIEVGSKSSENVFMDLDSLCDTAVIKAKTPPNSINNRIPAAMEKLVHELISDRLLTLSKYIILDSSTRTIMIDQSSLTTDGYQVITH